MTYTPNFLPGIDAYCGIGAAEYAIKKWMAKMSAKLGETPNMLSEAMMLVPGMYRAQVTLSSLYDHGTTTTYTVNDSYDLLLGYTDDVELDIGGLCESVTPSVDSTEPQAWEAIVQSSGTFTPSLDVNGSS